MPPPDAAPAPPVRARTVPGATTAATAHVVLFVASLVAAAALGSGAVPQPTSPTAELLAYARDEARTVGVVALLQFLSALALLVLAALVGGRARPVGTASTPGSALGRLVTPAGTAAAVLAAVAALTSWVVVTPDVAGDPAAVRELVVLGFVLGGPGYAGVLGVFFLALAADGRHAGLPAWLTGSGVVLAATGLLSALVLVVYAAAPLIPLTRFLGFLWLVALSVAVGRRPPATLDGASGRSARGIVGHC